MMTYWHQKDEAASFTISKLQIKLHIFSCISHEDDYNSTLMEECHSPQRPDMPKNNFQNPISIKTFSPLT
jgi:hypothetical protein